MTDDPTTGSEEPKTTQPGGVRSGTKEQAKSVPPPAPKVQSGTEEETRSGTKEQAKSVPPPGRK